MDDKTRIEVESLAHITFGFASQSSVTHDGYVHQRDGTFEELPPYLSSIDAAMRLTKEGWYWYVEEYSDFMEMGVEIVGRGGSLCQRVEWKDYPNHIEAWATARTLAALKACGIDIDKLLGLDT